MNRLLILILLVPFLITACTGETNPISISIPGHSCCLIANRHTKAQKIFSNHSCANENLYTNLNAANIPNGID
jgi:hypothetical protein